MSDNLKKIFIGIVLLILCVGLMQNCNNNKYNQLKGKYEILENQYKKHKDGVKVFEDFRIKQKDSLNLEIGKREQVNKQLTYTNQQLQTKIFNVSNRPIKTYPNVTPEINIKLNQGDKCVEIIPLKDEQIKNQDTQIVNLEKDKSDIKVQLNTAEQDILKRKELEKSADENISNLKSQVNKLKTKSTLNKILIPVALGVGGFLGYQIAK